MDLFSQPFNFRFGKEDQTKKTLFGKIISIFVVVVSLLYGAYLVYAYVNGSFQPTITRTSNTVSSVTQVLSYSPLMLKFHLPSSATSYTPYFTIYAQKGEGSVDGATITTTDCSNIPLNSAYSGYVCIDITDATYSLFIDSQASYNQIYLRVLECNSGGNCDSQNQITSVLETRDFEIEILVATQQYDVSTQTVSLVTDRKTIPGDSTIVAWQLLSFVQTELQVDKGFFWASWSTQYLVSSYIIDTIPLSNSYVLTKYSLSSPVVLQFEIRMKFQQDLIQIQWIKFSTLIAMFLSIFQTLTVLGILASMSSNAMIYQEMMDIYLREYYKQTADEIIQLNKKQLLSDQNELKDMTSQLRSNNLTDNLGISEEQILGTNSEMIAFKHYYLQSKSAKKDAKIGVVKVANDQEKKIQKKQDINVDDVYRHIWHKLPDMMNASSLYQEMFRLKTALQILFTREQYAALGLVSRRLPDFDNIEQTDFKSLNHIEQLDIMEETDQFKHPVQIQFIDRMRKSPNTATEVDKRIWESLLDHLRDEGNEQNGKDNIIESISNQSLDQKVDGTPSSRIPRTQI